MNAVRLGIIASMGAIAWYALTIYAGMAPAEPVVRKFETACVWTGAPDGTGPTIIALVAIIGAISVAATDLARRIY